MTIPAMQMLFLWESMSLPVVSLRGDEIIYRNEWAELRFPGAAVGADIRGVIGELQYSKVKKADAFEETEIFVSGCTYTVFLLPAEGLTHLIFVGSQREYKFTGWHELALMGGEMKEIASNLVTLAGMLPDVKPQLSGILWRNICRLVRQCNTLRYLTELRTGEMNIAPTFLDLNEELREIAALWTSCGDGLAALTLEVPEREAFRTVFDRNLFAALVCRLLSCANARCSAENTIKITLSQAQDTFTVTVTDDGTPLAPETAAVLNCTEAFTAAECRLPASAALDAAVVWQLATSLGGTVAYTACETGTTAVLTLPYTGALRPMPAAPTMQMEFVVSDGISPIKVELSPLLKSDGFTAG